MSSRKKEYKQFDIQVRNQALRIQKIADKSDLLIKKQLAKARKNKTPDVASAGVGAGHVGTDNWNEKMGLY